LNVSGRSRVIAELQVYSFQEATMKATVKRGNSRRTKSTKEIVRDASKAATGGPAKRGTKRGTARAGSSRSKTVNYPITETLRWVADGERLLIQWGAIKSPGAKRIANGVGKVLSVLEALTELRRV
jgi:hypothetical protein